MSTTDRYIIRKTGQPFTSGYRVYIEKDNEIISPWHDIPLYNDEQKGILNMIVEIPRWSNAKMEVRISHQNHIYNLFRYRQFISVLCRYPKTNSFRPLSRISRKADHAMCRISSRIRDIPGIMGLFRR